MMNLPHVCTRTALTALVLALAVAEVQAQSNTLFGGRRPQPRPPVPSSQPVAPNQAPPPGSGGDATYAPPGSPAAPRADAIAAAQRATADNEVLLAVSPFAVEQPAPKEVAVQDQITIIVRESKTAISDAKYEANRDWQHEWTLSDWVCLSGANGLVPVKFADGSPKVKFDYTNDYSADGTYDRTDELTTRIQATVLDIKPNGTLVLEATKKIKIDEEGYEIKLTGTCRSDDITPQNTVLSTQIADMQIDVAHQGAVREATTRGWIVRLVDFVRLF